jgi:hypothetical protein
MAAGFKPSIAPIATGRMPYDGMSIDADTRETAALG